MKIFITRDLRGRVLSVGASSVRGVGIRPKKDEAVEVVESPALKGKRLHAQLTSLMKEAGMVRPTSAGRAAKGKQTRAGKKVQR